MTNARTLRIQAAAQYTRSTQHALLQREVAGAQEVRQLSQLQAVAALSINGAAQDDIITTTPLYL